MTIKHVLTVGAIVAGLMSLPGCNDSSSPAAMNPPPQTQYLTTAQLLQIAETPSETMDPTLVGPGGILVADLGDETSDPIAVGP